ncbi:hypothetical protein E0668_24160, partial [Salmonella enterica subsp. enterica]|nr:hypothetical protein [Salmonella enterica subsp. enterica serovar Paratyphi A]
MDSSWERHIIADPMHGGMPVAAFYHPPGWQAGSQVMWNPAEKQSPVRIIAHAGPPDGSLTLEFLPSQAYAWPPMPLTMPGQNADGVIMMQPMPAADAVVRMIVPAFRARCDNLQVISAEQVNMPAPSDPRIPPGAAQVFKARVRIRYSFKGVEREEEFRAEQTIIHGGMTFWQLHNVASFSAPAGALDANLSIFDHVEQSWFENEQWKTLLQQVVSQGLAAANAQINAQIEAGRMQTERFIQESNARMQRNADYVARQGARIAAMEGGPYLGTTKTFSASDMLGGDRG